MTLQYEPAGRPVMKVVLHALSALLIATKPSAPVIRVRQYSLSSTCSREVRTACKGDLLVGRGGPSCERRAADLIPESDHAGDRLPAVLAEPAKGPCLECVTSRGDCEPYVPVVRSYVAGAGSST